MLIDTKQLNELLEQYIPQEDTNKLSDLLNSMEKSKLDALLFISAFQLALFNTIEDDGVSFGPLRDMCETIVGSLIYSKARSEGKFDPNVN